MRNVKSIKNRTTLLPKMQSSPFFYLFKSEYGVLLNQVDNA